ncbi:site-specific recombinase XerD [Schinkia azotoformans MEV2011]|uniref:Site-specific recombinase XerD n=1 Tax=Schinkia azotoformans MEV2011 TaxID=1348973 RepID=A0A072NTU3_SCHAZ|nr:tyrosine-type recombinase/integrase [Schinkia azotoformans]KEF36635.1 site-specific recombinase XerD [Schinkia azotoformans MEV2011]MEC1695600.1 tyrosine-type recombinase/integrase [Schinkia azotoformans]MEC1714231.1 tyrosine-type recombinase/integrase [Schinkia azotoformans]MEC1723994.1 tyrosine-type recombinase/integrase [Schinkia azotoformans]MEC1742446.1 tyrosine-type recombinase/integrase [Schinkia azotoformans]
MEFVEPIKDIEKINAIKELLKKQSQRDLLLFVLGINTGIRVNDLLSLRVAHVREGDKIKEFLYLKDANRDDTRAYYLNSNVQKELISYFASYELKDSDFLFKSKKNEQPITRQQAYRIINKVAKDVGILEKIGMHTLRKTFGYHAYRKGIAISILMEIYNHHSSSETLHYIGIDKNDIRRHIKVDVNL